jgi:hypothetical protein
MAKGRDLKAFSVFPEEAISDAGLRRCRRK